MSDSKMSDSNTPPKGRSYEMVTKYFDRYFFKTDNMSLIKLILYTPFGIILVLIRVFFLSILALLLNFLPNLKDNHHFICTVCWIFGIFTTQENFIKNKSDKVRVYVSNHITCLDYLPIKLVACGSKYLEDALMNRNLSSKHASHNTLSNYLKKILQYDAPKDTDNLYINKHDFPFIFFPELIATNGDYGVLKFDQKPFSLEREEMKVAVIPVALKAYRPIISISLNWLGSNDLINIFFMLFTPFTIYKATFYPEETLKENETSDLFADRVQKIVANGLKLICSNLDRDNIRQMYTDYEKNQQEQQERMEQERNAQNTPQAPNRNVHFNEISRVALQVKNVLPNISYETVREHVILTSSNDVDTIITSILDSGIDLEPKEPNPAKPVSTHNFRKMSPKSSPGTFINYETRKFNLLNEARQRYLAKHPVN